MTRLLVINGYDTQGITALKAAKATNAGVLYKNLLSKFIPATDIDIIEISHAAPAEIDISQYDGVCWTGSNLSFSSGEQGDILQRHITLCRDLFRAGTPQFGSCWAAQVAAEATGGSVSSNPKGREFGLARKIGLTEAGKTHPMYKGKPHVFDGLTSHGDMVTALPKNAILLASNSFSPVQAFTVTYGNGEFWAVQYHPEYDCAEIGALVLARQDGLIAQGIFQTSKDVTQYAKDMQILNQDKTRKNLAWKWGIDSDILDKNIRTIEVQNWLTHFFKIQIL